MPDVMDDLRSAVLRAETIAADLDRQVRGIDATTSRLEREVDDLFRRADDLDRLPGIR